jgi:hypothetical protein
VRISQYVNAEKMGQDCYSFEAKYGLMLLRRVCSFVIFCLDFWSDSEGSFTSSKLRIPKILFTSIPYICCLILAAKISEHCCETMTRALRGRRLRQMLYYLKGQVQNEDYK